MTIHIPNYTNKAAVPVTYWQLSGVNYFPVLQNKLTQKTSPANDIINIRAAGFVSEEAYKSGKDAAQVKQLWLKKELASDSITTMIDEAIKNEPDFKGLEYTVTL